MNLKISEQRALALKTANAIVDAAKSGGRELTSTETAEVNGHIAAIKAFDVHLEAVKANAATSLLNIAANSTGAGHDSGHLALTGSGAKSAASKIAQALRATDGTGRKALLPAGTVAITTPVSAEPYTLGRRPVSLLDQLPLVKHEGSRFAYLAQGSRTNNAAPVAVGGLKPTSVYGITRVETDLVVIAHLSEAIDKYWLEDADALQRFITDELIYGLRLKVEDQVLNGTGTTPNMRGLLQTVGRQTQAAIANDPYGTARAAITSMESVGQTPGLFVFAPADWAKLETFRDADGAYYFGGPVDRGPRTLWGVQVVTTPAIAAGKAALFDVGAVAVDTDTQGIEVKWSENVGTDFSLNQLRARVEGRFAASAYQALGIVDITLPA